VERSERERQSTKAAVKSEELRDVRESLDKSLRTVGEDATNLRTMLGKSLRRIDKYTESNRKGQPLSVSDLETDQSNIDDEIIKVNGHQPANDEQTTKYHHRKASGGLRTRRSLGKSPEKVAHQNGSNGVVANGYSDSLEEQSPTRRFRRPRKSIN